MEGKRRHDLILSLSFQIKQTCLEGWLLKAFQCICSSVGKLLKPTTEMTILVLKQNELRKVRSLKDKILDQKGVSFMAGEMSLKHANYSAITTEYPSSSSLFSLTTICQNGQACRNRFIPAPIDVEII